MLRASHLTFSFGTRRVVDDVSLEVPADGLVGILGPNGCGKTTLIRLLAGALSPASGTVTLDDVPLGAIERREKARRVAVVPQQTQLAFDYSVLDVVLMGRYPHLGAFAVEGPADLAAAENAMRATGTGDLADRSFHTLSGGEQQRVAIASALAQLDRRGTAAGDGGRYLMLDEPTASLDLRYQVEIAELIGQLHDEAEASASPMAILTSTHDLRFASATCRHVILMAHGRIVAAGPPTTVLTAATLSEVYDLPTALTTSLVPQ